MNFRTPVFLAAWLGLCAPLQAAEVVPMSDAQQQSLAITAAPVAPVTSLQGQPLPAQVTIPPTQLHLIAAPQAGLITRLDVAVGDAVHKGEALAQLKSPAVLALQRDFLQALTQQRLAQSARARDEALFQEGIIAKRRYLETNSRFEEMNAALDERRHALILAGMATQDVKRLERNRRLTPAITLRSSIDGVVLERKAEVGQRVAVSDPIYRIARTDPLWLEIRAPLEQISGVKRGTPVQVSGLAAGGRVLAVGHDVDPASQTVLVRAEITAGTDTLRPGQYVQASLESGQTTTRYKVPANAVIRSGDQTYVFVKVAEGYRVVPVTVLATQEGESVVSGELKAGDAVAVSGVAAIKGAWKGIGGE